MMESPYRDIHHLLNRALSGVCMEQYIKSGWQNSYTARAADVRRLDNFSDGLNSLERNAQDALTLNLIRKALKDKHELFAILWTRHNRDDEMMAMFTGYLTDILTQSTGVESDLCRFVLLEFSGSAKCSFRQFLLHLEGGKTTCYRQRQSVLNDIQALYDDAVGRIESSLNGQGLWITHRKF